MKCFLIIFTRVANKYYENMYKLVIWTFNNLSTIDLFLLHDCELKLKTQPKNSKKGMIALQRTENINVQHKMN